GPGRLDHAAPARLVAAKHLDRVGALVPHGFGDDLLDRLLGLIGVERLPPDDRVHPGRCLHRCSLRRAGTTLPALAFGEARRIRVQNASSMAATRLRAKEVASRSMA